MEQSVKEILTTIDDAINTFQEKIPGIQKVMYDELQPLLKDLEIQNGKLLNNVKNLKFLGQIKNKLGKIIINPDYKEAVKKFIDSYNTLSTLNMNYFTQFNKKYTPSATLPYIKQLAIESTITDLVGQGMSETIVGAVKDILNTNITTGGSYAGLQEQLRDHILNNDSGEGNLSRYTKQITTDAINQYHAQYHATIAQDLQFNWGRYVGSLITTSREFCILLTAKEWIHKSELPAIIEGHIDGKNCKLSKTTKLPLGMIPGTNAFNFKINRGGYQCGHHYFEVPDSAVPELVRMKFAKPDTSLQTKKELPVDENILRHDSKFEIHRIKMENEKDTVHNELSAIEKASIYNYSASGYSKLNNFLRGGEGFESMNGTKKFSPADKEYLQSLSNSLENGLNKMDANYSGVVYRGVSLPQSRINEIKQLYENKSAYSEPFFQSTSYKAGLSYPGNAQFVITSKTGKLIQPLTKYGVQEKEVLFNRNTPFKIKSIEQSGDQTVFIMEEI